MKSLDDIFVIVGSILFVLFIGLGILFAVVWFHANIKCLEAGFRDTRIDFLLNAYCIKRVDQTDIVVPVKEAVKK